MIKVGILGTGFGEHHAKLYTRIKGFKVVKIFGRNNDKLRKIENDLCIKTTTDINDVIQDPNIDVLDICLPTELHSKWAVEGMKHGKHIFCETPLSYRIEEAEEVKRASVQYGKNVFVDMFLKFSMPHRMAIELIQKGEFGTLNSLRSYHKSSPRWGDLGIKKNIETFHIHNIDFIYGIMDGMPKDATVFLLSKKWLVLFIKVLLQRLVKQMELYLIG